MSEPRSAEAIVEAEERLFNRLWAVRAEHRSLEEYESGWLDGALQALRWVLGDGVEIEDASLDT